MKKSLLAAAGLSAVMAIHGPDVMAYELKINGVVIPGVSSIAINSTNAGQNLSITTVGGDFSVIGGSGENPGGGNENPGGGNENPGGGNENPGGGENEDLCASPQPGVVCNYHITNAQMASSAILQQTVSIPKGSIVASSFTVPTGDVRSTVTYQIPPNNPRWVKVWISASPGGDPLAPRCEATDSVVAVLSWQNYDQEKRCVTPTPGKTYYLNMTNEDRNAATGNVTRKLNHTR